MCRCVLVGLVQKSSGVCSAVATGQGSPALLAAVVTSNIENSHRGRCRFQRLHKAALRGIQRQILTCTQAFQIVHVSMLPCLAQDRRPTAQRGTLPGGVATQATTPSQLLSLHHRKTSGKAAAPPIVLATYPARDRVLRFKSGSSCRRFAQARNCVVPIVPGT